MDNNRSISVIIPTIGRDSVFDALDSVYKQSVSVNEVIVCYDGDDFYLFSKKIEKFKLERSEDIILINVGPFSGGNVARQRGIDNSNCKYVALLDDDDLWLDNHIADLIQFTYYNDNELMLASCFAKVESSSNSSFTLPGRPISDNESLSDYLFKVRGLVLTCGFVQSSLLLFSKELALKIPFNQTLKFHQDIDWLLRLDQSQINFRYFQSNKVSVVYNSTPLSVSKRITPGGSISWARSVFDSNNKRCLGDFLLTQSLHYARQNGTFSDEINVLFSAIKYGKPGVASIIRACIKLLRIDLIKKLVKRV